VASASSDHTVKIWNPSPSPWTLIRTYTGHIGVVFDIENINVDTVVTGSNDQTIRIWSLNTGLTNKTINAGFGSPVFCLKVFNNGLYVATGLSSGNINIFEISLNNSNLLATLSGHKSSIYDLTLVGTNLLASSSQDQTIRLWNLTTYASKFTLKNHTQAVTGLKLITASILASVSRDYAVKLWDITNGNLIRTLKNHTNFIYNSVDLFSGAQIVSGSMDQTLKIWNFGTGQLVNTINTNFYIYSLAVL
jgi:WD40 repeat protein